MKNKKQDLSYLLDQYVLDYDYETTDCNGKCDDYCRCNKIIDLEIKGVYLSYILDKLDGDEIDKYCFDRILRLNKIYDTRLWGISTTSGYYGEEIEGANFSDEEKMFSEILKIQRLKSLKSKIEFILNTEYGYILDCLKGCKYKIQTIKKSDVQLNNKNYYNKIDKDAYPSDWNEEGLPIGIYTGTSSGGYRIIDGYHRFVANKNSEIRAIVAY